VEPVLIGYLKRHIKIIVLLCSFVAVFALVFSLYDLPVEAVWYSAVLCLFVGVILFAIGYGRYVSQHRALKSLLSKITVSLDYLPLPSGALERDYQALLQVLFNEKNRIESTADGTMSDLVEYFTMWVHQIKTPIAAMHLLLQAEESAQNSALAMELFKIEQYVNMVLQYLRVDTGTNDFVLNNYRLDDIVRQALRKYARLFILKKIELDFQESALTVLTDEKWLSFVVEQVLSNSLKYTSSGKISIWSADRTLYIEDTGIGIKAEDLPRVFERGFTGYNGRADRKSTGIGLYLCRRILDRLGHTISISSEPGRGTRVGINLESPAQAGE
jgi:signal transduction histidine kinase